MTVWNYSVATFLVAAATLAIAPMMVMVRLGRSIQGHAVRAIGVVMVALTVVYGLAFRRATDLVADAAVSFDRDADVHRLSDVAAIAGARRRARSGRTRCRGASRVGAVRSLARERPYAISLAARRAAQPAGDRDGRAGNAVGSAASMQVFRRSSAPDGSSASTAW